MASKEKGGFPAAVLGKRERLRLSAVQEETEPSSYGEEGEETEELAALDKEDDDAYIDLEEDDMPLLKYKRLFGSIPRANPEATKNNPLKSACTCTAVGRVILPPEGFNAVNNNNNNNNNNNKNKNNNNNNATAGMSKDSTSQSSSRGTRDPNDPRFDHPFYVMVIGFQSGQLCFVDMETGADIIPSLQLRVKEGLSNPDPIVGVSLDATGGFLGAINEGGLCAVWEIRYTRSKTANQQEDNVFANLLTTFAGPNAQQQQADKALEGGAILKTLSVQANRMNYPASFGKPTCLAIDPSYKRRREKAILVGFSQGRLVMTKKGFFNRRSDSVVYEGTKGPNYRGIEAITWRGPLVAWADASGIKIFDVENMTKIAHVDRPSGAAPSTHDTISALKPSLCFETSQNLLVAWGDCVMTMHVKETLVNRVSGGSEGLSGVSASAVSANPEYSQAVVKRRQVECTMAWELDCVACGVVPLDEDRVVVLGLVPTLDEDDDAAQNREEGTLGSNDVEIQVISRKEGSVVYADVIPVLKLPSQFKASKDGKMKESAMPYSLLSSFALPRMDNTIQAEEEEFLTAVEQDFDFNIFAAPTKLTFKDSHVKWNLKSVIYDIAAEPPEDDDDEKEEESKEEGKDEDGGDDDDGKDKADKGGDNDVNDGDADKPQDDGDDDDAASVDSDDYSFLLRPTSTVAHAVNTQVVPPIMVVASPADMVAVRTSDVDDAVEHALALKKLGLALERGLRHKRKLRDHDIDDLVDQYLKAVLRIEPSEDGETNATNRSLSIRRLRLGAAATPKLLGGSVKLWKRWLREFTKIPGALFIVSEHLPVRDPQLPYNLYQDALHTMFRDVVGMESGRDPKVFQHGKKRFTRSLLEWGPTHALRERITFHKYLTLHYSKSEAGTQTMAKTDLGLVDVEAGLTRRLTQSAVGYLELTTQKKPAKPEPLPESALLMDSVSDSLFPMDELLESVADYVSVIEKPSDEGSDKTKESKATIMDTHVALETAAHLSLMTTNYKDALKCFLAIGILYSQNSVRNLEREALEFVNTGVIQRPGGESAMAEYYSFVLGMIEHRHLHRALLDPASNSVVAKGKTRPSLVALMLLIGLDAVGDFLVEHCVPPARTPAAAAASASSEGNDSLPLDLVAEVLRPSRPLLHWYLHLISEQKPETYVIFPDTSVPPKVITDLHKTHLDLYMEFAVDRDSSKAIEGTEAYLLEMKTTRLLSFLKAALSHGGIRPGEVRKSLRAKRKGNSKDGLQYPHAFAIELAYVIEEYGDESLEDAREIMDLYLTGTKSVMLAASYAQRCANHTVTLWNDLIDHCLDASKGSDADDTLFSSLLESAALCGADLALLVTRIPEGMNVKGLRSTLVSAVADYRLKLKMHKSTAETGEQEKINLLRELGHRSRRGTRFFTATPPASKSTTDRVIQKTVQPEASNVLLPTHRTIKRPARYHLTVGIPMR